MSTIAIVLFIGAALLIAAYLIASSVRTGRVEEFELTDARARADQARREAEEARAVRSKLSEPVYEDDDIRVGAPLPGNRFNRDPVAPEPLPPAGRRART